MFVWHWNYLWGGHEYFDHSVTYPKTPKAKKNFRVTPQQQANTTKRSYYVFYIYIYIVSSFQ